VLFFCIFLIEKTFGYITMMRSNHRCFFSCRKPRYDLYARKCMYSKKMGYRL